jgi:hypothetical protein
MKRRNQTRTNTSLLSAGSTVLRGAGRCVIDKVAEWSLVLEKINPWGLDIPPELYTFQHGHYDQTWLLILVMH